MLVNEMNHCREHYEHSLLQIQTLQAELHDNRLQTVKLQHKMEMYEVDETVKLCDSILNGTPRSDVPNPCLNLNYNKGTVALHTGLTDEGRGRTVVYSNDLDVGLGLMLGNCVGHQKQFPDPLQARQEPRGLEEVTSRSRARHRRRSNFDRIAPLEYLSSLEIARRRPERRNVRLRNANATNTLQYRQGEEEQVASMPDVVVGDDSGRRRSPTGTSRNSSKGLKSKHLF
ncbi:hypothetical protein EVAR_83958_1 [Eumeta japonica]|uniref:Uncharacterized protein n=1 Tax=Eumeta variegata TaxID=151549 RepID=A0A4C1VMC7_EUMVA|nr:hypothetical protein EVAR_83958_1 [Eumeta japonica]